MTGYYDDEGNLIYAGKVGTGFTDESLRVIGKELHARERKTAPFCNPPQGPEAKGVTWLAPELVAEIEFTGWTEDGKLRHPSFKGLRDDKPAKDVRREAAKSLRSVDAGSTESEMKERPSARARKSHKGHKSTVDGVVVSNPDKEMFPEGISKIALVEYYGRMSQHILPHVVHRPLTLLRCPNGRAKNCFYQKHPQNAVPDSVRSVPIREKEGKADYLVIDDEKGLLELVNLGVLEFHVWGGREDQIEKPDLMVFDLDPDPGVSRAALTEAAFLLRDRLESLGLKSFLKTTGGKGFHIVTPPDRRHSWDDVKEFSRAVAKEMVKNDPKRYIATMSKAKRKGRIFIDCLRNSRGATFVIPYGTRARPHAPVSAPLRWDELKKDTDPAGWTIANIEARLDSVDDPWAEYSSTRQSITVAMKKEMGLT
jgi:bifunctional non-homologous end joining protein LigD